MFEDMGKIFVKYWDLFLIKGLSATILLSIMTVALGTVFGALLALIKIGKITYASYFVAADAEHLVPADYEYQISGNNLDGYIITAAIPTATTTK
jgi:hypothetical protein